MLPSTGPDVAAACAAARGAQPVWADGPVKGRVAVLQRVRDLMHRDASAILDALQHESGKNFEDVQNDYLGTLAALSYWTAHAPRFLADRKVRSSSPIAIGRSTFVAYDPVGVVGVIGPWNAPLLLTFGDAIPALLAGNAVIMKPSEHTPLSNALLPPLIEEAGAPSGVLQALCGGPTTGAELVDDVDAVMFTGSVATGRSVARRAAERLVPCTVELGGKDAMIVLADADLDRAAGGAAFYGLANGGQVCMSVERIYVDAVVHDEFVQRLVAKVAGLRVGSGQPAGMAEISPFVAPTQLDIVRAHLQDAIDRGACVEVGGDVVELGGRTALQPTVLTRVDHSMTCMREETFGPVLPVMAVAGPQEAVRLANDSPYGLTASVWTGDLERGAALARQIDAGVVMVNDATVVFTAHDAPFGGTKASGLGRRHGGADGIRKFCHAKTIQIARWTPKGEPLWFPYTKRRTRLIGRIGGAFYGGLAARSNRRRPPRGRTLRPRTPQISLDKYSQAHTTTKAAAR